MFSKVMLWKICTTHFLFSTFSYFPFYLGFERSLQTQSLSLLFVQLLWKGWFRVKKNSAKGVDHFLPTHHMICIIKIKIDLDFCNCGNWLCQPEWERHFFPFAFFQVTLGKTSGRDWGTEILSKAPCSLNSAFFFSFCS